jgi:hypothetical protein
MRVTAGDGNDVTTGTVVVYEETGDLGKVTDVYEDAGQAQVIFHGKFGLAPFLVALEDLNVAADQEWAP